MKLTGNEPRHNFFITKEDKEGVLKKTTVLNLEHYNVKEIKVIENGKSFDETNPRNCIR